MADRKCDYHAFTNDKVVITSDQATRLSALCGHLMSKGFPVVKTDDFTIEVEANWQAVLRTSDRFLNEIPLVNAIVT